MDKMIVTFKPYGSIGGKVSTTAKVGGKVRNPDKVYVKELVFSTHYEFPSVGEADKLYIAKDENAIYRFDEDEMGYTILGLQAEDIKFINGGNANAE